MVRLIPRDEKFFDLFTKTGEIILEASRKLESMLSAYDRLHERVAEIQALEKQGDGVDREVAARLERSFITQERTRELLGLSPWDDLPARAPKMPRTISATDA